MACETAYTVKKYGPFIIYNFKRLLNGVDYYATQLQGKWALPLICGDSDDSEDSLQGKLATWNSIKSVSFRLLSRGQVKYKYELSFYLLGYSLVFTTIIIQPSRTAAISQLGHLSLGEIP